MSPLTRRALLRGAAGTSLALSTGLAGYLPAVPAATAPAVFIAGAQQWGARPPLESPVFVEHRPVRILIHHTATDNSTDYSVEHAYELARFIQNLHMDRNDWGDTGQHFTNSRGGVLLEGRHQSLATLREGRRMVVGAHCPGQNSQAIGIENEGHYMESEPPEQQWRALVAFCAYTCRQYRIAPTEIFGHRDYRAGTVCPGDRLYARLPQLRTEVAALVR